MRELWHKRYLKYLTANCFPLEKHLSWSFGENYVVRGLSLEFLRVFVNPLVYLCFRDEMSEAYL